jgi:hypothetical protein
VKSIPFINQEEAHFHAERRRPALQQAAFTLQQLALIVIEPGLMADPDIQVRGTALLCGRVRRE